MRRTTSFAKKWNERAWHWVELSDFGGDDRLRRVSPIAVCPGDGPLTERTAGVQPAQSEQVFLLRTCR